MWRQLCKVKRQKDYKYSVKDALELVDVHPDTFMIALRKYKAEVGPRKFVRTCFQHGFGQLYDSHNRVQFVQKIMGGAKESPENEGNESLSEDANEPFGLSDVDLDSHTDDARCPSHTSELFEKDADLLNAVLFTYKSLSEESLLQCLTVLCEGKRVASLVAKIAASGECVG